MKLSVPLTDKFFYYPRSKDDENIPITTQPKSKAAKLPPRDPDALPKVASLISGKYVTYTRSSH